MSNRITDHGTVSGGLTESGLSGESLNLGPGSLEGQNSRNEPGLVTRLRGAGDLTGEASRAGVTSEAAPRVNGDSPRRLENEAMSRPLTSEGSKVSLR